MQMYIVLALLVFMIFMFFTNKVPYGVTTMTCCVVLALTGVFDIPTAFSGTSQQDNDLGCLHVYDCLCVWQDQLDQ